MHRHPDKTAEDWCVSFYKAHANAAYMDQDLSKIIDDVRGADKDIQWLLNTKQHNIMAWQALMCTVTET